MELQESHGSSSGTPLKNGVLTSQHMEPSASGSRLLYKIWTTKLKYYLLAILFCFNWTRFNLIKYLTHPQKGEWYRYIQDSGCGPSAMLSHRQYQCSLIEVNLV